MIERMAYNSVGSGRDHFVPSFPLDPDYRRRKSVFFKGPIKDPKGERDSGAA